MNRVMTIIRYGSTLTGMLE